MCSEKLLDFSPWYIGHNGMLLPGSPELGVWSLVMWLWELWCKVSVKVVSPSPTTFQRFLSLKGAVLLQL